MAKTGRTDVVLNLKVSDGELSLIFDKAKKGFARLSQDQKDSLKLQEKQDAAAKKYSITKTTEGKSIAKTNVETREEIRLATLAQTQKIQVTKAVEKLAFANSKSNIKIQEHNVLAREQNRVLSLELNQKIQLKRSEERLAFAYSDTGKQIEKNNALTAEKNRQTKLEVSRDIELVKAQESLAFWTSKKGKELAKANLQAKEAQNQAKLLAIKEMEAADAAKELSNATKGVAKGFDQMKTTAGLSGAIVTEVGRTISDAPYGLRGMGNNISQLASLFGMFAVNVKKSGRTMTQGFKQLGASLMGPIGFITGLQVVIALIQSGAFSKFYNWLFDTNKEIKNLNKEVISQADTLRSYVKVLKNANSSEGARIKASKELVKTVTGVTDATELEKMSTEELTKSVEDYITQQSLRAELDAEIEANKEIFAKREKIRRVEEKLANAESAEERKEIYKANSDILDVYFDMSKASMEAAGGKGLIARLFGSDEDIDFLGLFEEQSKDAIKQYDEAIDRVTKIQAKLIGTEEGGGPASKRVVKEFKKRASDFLSEIQGFEEELLETTSRTQIKIIEDEQKAKKVSINIKRDKFKEDEKLRLKNYIAQQEANKKLKGADIVAIDAAIARAKDKSAKSIQESDNEADRAIEAINKVTKARISNQEDLDKFNKSLIKSQLAESSAETNLALMPEGMAKVEAEAALDQLRYDNKVLAAEQELALLTTTEERKREIQQNMQLWENEKRVTDLENERNVINEKTRIQEQYISYLSGLSSILSAIGSKNEGLRKAALVAEKSAAIASVITQASKSIGEQSIATAKTSQFNLANLAAAGGPTNLAAAAIFAKSEKANKLSYAKNIAMTKTSAGISIAAIAAGTIAGLRGSSDSSGGGGTTAVQAPDFNIVGSTGVNQLAEAIGETTKEPIKAYVVSSDVTTAQELDRNIIDSASL